jgi:hypothetical protein
MAIEIAHTFRVATRLSAALARPQCVSAGGRISLFQAPTRIKPRVATATSGSPAISGCAGLKFFHRLANARRISRSVSPNRRGGMPAIAEGLRPQGSIRRLPGRLFKRGGGTAACAPPPVSLTPQRSQGPPQRNLEGAADRWGLAAAFPPMPCRWCGSHDKAPSARTNGHKLGSRLGRKMSVRKGTLCLRELGRFS